MFSELLTPLELGDRSRQRWSDFWKIPRSDGSSDSIYIGNRMKSVHRWPLFFPSRYPRPKLETAFWAPKCFSIAIIHGQKLLFDRNQLQKLFLCPDCLSTNTQIPELTVQTLVESWFEPNFDATERQSGIKSTFEVDFGQTKVFGRGL